MKSIYTLRFASFLLALFFCIPAFAQVTTGSVNGTVRDSKGESIAGATIKVTHLPSGTVYAVITQANGSYSILGVRVGSDYELEVSFIGFHTRKYNNIAVSLGDPVKVDAVLEEASLQLSEVVVVGEKASAFNKEKTGAATNISNREMTLMPTLNRSLSDYTKISPYSTGGSSFLGREAYNSNITVDGANFNNNFGLTNAGMPSVSGEPISMDAIEEMQIVVAPFDVRQSNFTGAGVNAVTKSGTNQFRGTAYGLYRNQNFNGKKIRDKELPVTESAKQVLGFSLGWPILKNKLFFFVSAEKENTLTPGYTLLAMDEGRDPDDLNVNTRVQAADLKKFADILKSKYNYDPGRYEDWGGDDELNNKILARIDWNIDNNHKFTARYNFSNSEAVFRPSNSGDARPSLNNNAGRAMRNGGIVFENSQYYNTNKLHSITGELNSRFNKLHNNLLVAYTNYFQPRKSDSDMFPMIDIMDGSVTSTSPMMTAGYELFSYKNEVTNNTLILTDNVTYQLGEHKLTAGLSFEHQYFANSYLRQGTGYYRFKDLASFERFANGEGNGMPYNSDYHPVDFAFTYPINGYTDPKSELSFAQLAVYVQDEWNIFDNLKVTVGLRIDRPSYLDGAIGNDSVKNYTFNGESIDLSTWPDAKILWSPRLGFRWDALNDKSLIVRGGTGVFTGRLPFVWFTNQPSNSGMLQYQLIVNGFNGSNNNAAAQAILARLPYMNINDVYNLLNDPALADIFPTQNVVGGRIAAIDKNFKLPQVWRTSLGADLKLPLEMVLTLEGVYTKDLNNIRFENINLKPAESTLMEGDQSRPYWSNASGAAKYYTPTYTDVVVMKNTHKGQGVTFSSQLTLPKLYGLNGFVAYTFNWSEEVNGKNGSDPFSAWQYRYIHESLNSEELGYPYNNTPHRVIASLNYKISYWKDRLSSTFAVFYTGYKGGAYSYYYSNDANGDGTTSDLMYIPKNQDDFIWKNGQADADAYFAFAAQDPYLSKHAGEYMMRNGAFLPWYNRIDFRFLQDLSHTIGKSKNTLQLSVDIFNVANLLSSSWGLNKTLVTSSPLKMEGRDAATGKAIVSMNKYGTPAEYPTESFQDPSTVSATWALQLGIRYIFN